MNKCFLVLFSFIIIYSCHKNLPSKVVRNETTLVLDKDIYTYTNYLMQFKADKNTAKYAVYKNLFKIGIYDQNQNGKFNDYGQDILFIASLQDSFANISPEIALSANYLEPINSIEFNSQILFVKLESNQKIKVIQENLTCGTFNKSITYLDSLVNIYVEGIDGKLISLDTLKKSKPLLITFYASWCQPCLDKLQLLNKSNDLSFDVLVLADKKDQLSSSIEYYHKLKYRWPLAVANDRIKKLFHQNGFPYQVYITEDNKIITDQFKIAEVLSK